MGVDIATEKDIERLRMFSELQARENARLRRKLAAAAREMAKVEGLDPQAVIEAFLADVAAGVNGTDTPSSPLDSKSERWSAPPDEDAKSGAPQTGHGPTDQPDLQVQEQLFELDEADCICPKCGGNLVAIEGLTEDSEEVDVFEVRYVLRQIRKQKYRCDCSDCQHIETALGPDVAKPVRNGRYTLNFAVQVLLDKYASHLPLDRQSRMMREHGLRVSSQTLWDYVWAPQEYFRATRGRAGRLRRAPDPDLRVAVERGLVRRGRGADETRWRLMGKKKDAKPQIIALTSDAGVWYGIEHDKTADTLDRLLGDFAGVLIADGLNIYKSVRDRRTLAFERLETERPPFTLAQCWAHARRNFIQASRGDPDVEELILRVGRLYRLKRAYDPDHHERWQEWVDVVLRGIQQWMAEQRPLPGSQLEQAIGYMQERWTALTLFRDRPEIWLDNNGTERALRLAIQGRKNHYGSRSERGMHAAAVIYSLIETCDRLDVNMRDYFTAALTRTIDNPGAVYTPAMHLADLST